MKITKTEIYKYSIPMVPFTIATGTMQFAQNIFIRLHTDSFFKWTNENPDVPGSTVFSFLDDSDYFSPSESKCMINFRVKDLAPVIDYVKHKGVWCGR